MANYTYFQNTTNGKNILQKLKDNGLNVEIEPIPNTTSSIIKIDGQIITKGVIPFIKGFLLGLKYQYITQNKTNT